MSYIWEEYSPENYFYIPEKKSSYYEEVWRKNGKNIPVNVFNRFGEIFYASTICEDRSFLYEVNKRYKNDDRFKEITNLIIHQMALFDRLAGITLEDIKMALVYDDIISGLYGDLVCDVVDSLQFEDLYIILKELVKNIDGKQSEVVFDEILHLLFGKVIFYKENSTEKTMIYIEKTGNEYRKKLYELVNYLFADMGLEIEVFWANEHFGIIGVDSTMKIDKLCVY